ncbi:MAG: Transglutaminase-like superfamily protein [Actinobacteria bacterium ADurb.Bin346]|nr:MAG: Transglutaminase-like superfamily protein [Actinobacteria bacterium ADurb.Bin346]
MLKKILLAGASLTVAIIITISLVSCCFSIDFDAFKTTTDAENREDSIAQDTETETAETTADESTPLEKPELYLISKLKVPGQAIDVKSRGGFAYLTNDLGILFVVDVKDKENPKIIGKCSGINAANIVIIQGDYAYTSYTDWQRPKDEADDSEGTEVYSVCGFKIIDIRDKKNPIVVGDYISGSTGKKSVQGLAIQDDYAFLNSTRLFDDYAEYSESALEIIDLSNKSNPVLKGQCSIEGQPNGLFVSGNYAYLNNTYYDYKKGDYTGKSKFFTVDITDKSKPYIAGFCEVPGNSWSVFVEGKSAFLSSSKYDKENQVYNESMLQAIDISDPQKPRTAGNCSIAGGAWEIDIKDDFLFVSKNEGGIAVVDISDVLKPSVLTILNTGGNSYDIAIAGDYGYIADGFQGLAIIGLQKKEPGEGLIVEDTAENANKAPVAELEVFGDKTEGGFFISDNPVFFSAIDSYDPEGEKLTYSWEIDGIKLVEKAAKESFSTGFTNMPEKQFAISEKGEELAVNFKEPGKYIVKVLVYDGSNTAYDEAIIEVRDELMTIEPLKEHNFDVKIECVLTNNSGVTLKELKCYLRTPVTFSPWQTINSITASVPDTDQLFDDSWNMLTYLEFNKSLKVESGRKVSASIVSNVSMYEYDIKKISTENLEYEPDDEDLKLYTGEDLFIDISSPVIQAAAKKAAGDEIDQVIKAKKIYAYVASRLHYDWERAADRNYKFMDASEILKAGKGVCADYAILYTALLRANGIPSRVVGGIPVTLILGKKSKTLDIGHAWVEVKLPGYGWIPVDITQEQGFMKTDYFLNLATEKGTSFLYESQTMDWTSYYYDGFKYKWDGSKAPDSSKIMQKLYYSIINLDLTDLAVYK